MNKFQIGDEVTVHFADATISGIVIGYRDDADIIPGVEVVARAADGLRSIAASRSSPTNVTSLPLPTPRPPTPRTA